MDIKVKISSLNKNPEVMKYFKNTLWLLAEKALRLIVGLLVGIWVIRYLGPDKFGILSYTTSFVGLFIAFSTLGLDSVVVKALVKDKSQRDLLLGTAFILKLLGALFTIGLLVLVTEINSNTTEINFYIFIIASSTIFQSLNVIDLYFQSQVQSKFIIYSQTFAFCFTSIVKIVLILTDSPLIYFVSVVLLEAILVSMGFVFFYVRNKLPILKWEFEKSLAVELLRDSWPLILSGIAISIGLRIDQVMIKYFIDMREVGIYASGVRLAEVLMFIPMLISQSIFPKLVGMDFIKSEFNLIRLIRNVFYPLVCLVFVLSLSSEWLVGILYGQEYKSAALIFSILLWTIPMSYLGAITNKLLLIENCQKIIFLKQLALMILNVSLNFILIPMYGIVGAAIATLVADVLVNIFFDVFYKKSRWLFKLKVKALLITY